jgi:hypothetical protein
MLAAERSKAEIVSDRNNCSSRTQINKYYYRKKNRVVEPRSDKLKHVRGTHPITARLAPAVSTQLLASGHNAFAAECDVSRMMPSIPLQICTSFDCLSCVFSGKPPWDSLRCASSVSPGFVVWSFV